MKAFPSMAVVAFLSVAGAQVVFKPQKNSRRLRGNEGLNGLWGNLHQYGSCVQKISDPEDTTSDKVKFVPCDDWEPAQMWKFEEEVPYWNYTGLLYNMGGGCLAIRGDVEAGKNLKVLACDTNSAKQQWWADGDSLTPSENPDNLCVSSQREPIEPQDAVVLVDCWETGSLDY